MRRLLFPLHLACSARYRIQTSLYHRRKILGFTGRGYFYIGGLLTRTAGRCDLYAFLAWASLAWMPLVGFLLKLSPEHAPRISMSIK